MVLKPLLEPGFAQPVEEVIDAFPVDVKPGQVTFDEGKVGIERLHLRECDLRLLDPAKLTEPCDDIAEAGRPVPAECPRATADPDRFLIMA